MKCTEQGWRNNSSPITEQIILEKQEREYKNLFINEIEENNDDNRLWIDKCVHKYPKF